ncbi:MAG: ComF family protein [Solirubrobacterales bacterium]|nr:ComF family protein [Solirubrobacterales bacterium]
MKAIQIARLFVPPACAGCGSACEPERSVCAECLRDLDLSGPIHDPPLPDIDAISSVATHSGVGRSILSAYKFNGLFGLAPFIASRMSEVAPATGESGCVVPVPAAGLRRRLRGFDTAEDLAERLSGWTGLPIRTESLVRIGQGRQRGKGRSTRLADPPVIEAREVHDGVVLLVDDVVTTGATLAACARSLRESGAAGVLAVTFTRRV